MFTIGRGNDIQAAAVAAAADRLVGRNLDGLLEDPSAVNRELNWDSQLRWLGPDKGVMHMAVGAVMNALWNLRCKREGRPLWSTLAHLEPAEAVALVDWTYLRDFLDPARAREILEERRGLRDSRIADLRRDGLAACATSPGWLGYSDEKLDRLCRKAVTGGFTTIKLKVGANLDADRRRLQIARNATGPDTAIAIDANQRWSVPDAINAIQQLAQFDVRWVEEPTTLPGPAPPRGATAVRIQKRFGGAKAPVSRLDWCLFSVTRLVDTSATPSIFCTLSWIRWRRWAMSRQKTSATAS